MNRLRWFVVIGVMTSVAPIPLSNWSVRAAPGDASVFRPLVIPEQEASGSTFTMLPQSDSTTASCAQDTATGGWRWQTFFVEASIDVNDLRFDSAGPMLPGEPTAFVRPMFDPFLAPVVNRATAPGTGDIVDVPLYSFGAFAPGTVPAGDYKIGYACSTRTGVVDSFSERMIRITLDPTVTGFTWTTRFSDLPPVPVISWSIAGDGFAVIVFGDGINYDAVANSFEVTAIPVDGGPSTSVGATNGPILIPGLVNGTTYRVTVTARNGFGTSPPSRSVLVTPTIGLQPPIRPVFTKGAPGSGEATVSWVTPITVAPAGYTLTVTPPPTAPGADRYTLDAAVSSQVVTGLEPNVVYTFVLEPSYPAPTTGYVTPVWGSVDPSSIVQQRITVTRPRGQLVLTQRCGVNGNVRSYSGTSSVPGFPMSLPGTPRTSDQTGTPPDITPAAPGIPADAVDGDPEFGTYPFPVPVTHPTECGVALGTAKIVTTGDGAGAYFQANGLIDEVTVSDTRDADPGWTLNGTMNDFTGINTPTNTFDGDWMGWIPSLQRQTPNQSVVVGDPVLPGVGVAPRSTGPGLGSGALLGAASAGGGLGITEFDARLLLLIPASTRTDDYVGILDLTVI